MKVKTLTQTCRWQPSQWEGKTYDSKYIFIRERHNYLTVDIADSEEDFMQGKSECLLTINETGTNSMMTKEQMLELTKDVLDFTNCSIFEMDPF